MSKRVVIVGAGVVGWTCAQRLSRDGHDVVIVEARQDLVNDLLDQIDVKVIVGSGTSLKTLRQAELQHADLLLAVTDSDEVNLITALLAGSGFSLETQVIRLRSDEYLENLGEISESWPGKTYGIDPSGIAADQIVSLIDTPHAIHVTRLLEGKVLVAGFRVREESPIVHRTMAELRENYPDQRFLIASIARDGVAIIPTGETRLEPGDTVYFSTVPERLGTIHSLLGYDSKASARVVVGGGHHVAERVSMAVLQRKLSAVQICVDANEADELAIDMPEALVLNGSITEERILREAGIDARTTFVAATKSQQMNLLGAVLALRLGAGRVISLVDDPAYDRLATSMGIDAVVSPRKAAVSEILRFVRGEHFEQVESLSNEKIEVAVVDMGDDAPHLGQKVRELTMPKGTLIAAMDVPETGIVIPHGETEIVAHSRLVVFSPTRKAEKVANYFEHGR